MLTREILVANAALAGLTDEQIAAITTLSANDENSVIAKKTGEIYGGLDADILAASGIAKNGTEKTFDYAKRVVAEFKTKAESASALQTRRCERCGNRKGFETGESRFDGGNNTV